MGRIASTWCFVGWGPKSNARPYCAEAIVDSGATVPVIPEAQAKRLGVLVRDIDPRMVPRTPKDAQGRRAKGDYYLIGEMSSKAHGCSIDPVMVFGQPGKWRKGRPVIGREPLQSALAEVQFGPDTMRCKRAVTSGRSVGAALNLRAVLRRIMPKGDVDI